MSLFGVAKFVSVTPRRVVDDANNIRSNIDPIDVVVILGEAQPANSTGGRFSEPGKRFIQTGHLYTRRGSDLKDGDEITYQGSVFGVIGGPQFDMDHPMTGQNFGWVKYSIRKGG